MTRIRLPPAARLVLSATFATNVGNGMQMLAVARLLFDRTGSVSSFAGVILLQYLVTLATTLFAGSLVDHAAPKTVCTVVDGLRGLAVCVASATLLPSHPALAITVITLVIQLGKQFQRTAMFALEPRLVEAGLLARYNGAAVTCMQAGQLAGVSLCGVVLQAGGPIDAIFLNGLSFLASAALVACARVPAGAPAPAPAAGAPRGVRGVLHDWWSLARVIRMDRLLLTLLLLSAADYAVVDFINLSLVPIDNASFAANPYWLSLLDGSFAIGAIVAGLGVDGAIARLGTARAIVTGTGLQAALYLALLPAHVGAAALAVLFGLGAASTLSSVAVTTALQLRIPRAMQGRLGATRSLYVTVVAASLVPLVAQAMSVGLRHGLLLAGVLSAAFFAFAAALLRLAPPAVTGERGESTPSS